MGSTLAAATLAELAVNGATGSVCTGGVFPTSLRDPKLTAVDTASTGTAIKAIACLKRDRCSG
jgi:hypothetical protein